MDFSAWTEATGNLNWGAQNVIHNSLTLAADGKVTIVYGSDYVNGKPCLINSVGPMLEVGGGNGIPSQYFGALVSEFDHLNRQFASEGVNEMGTQYLSPLAAEILLKYFGELKPQPAPVEKPAPTTIDEALPGHREIIPEASDEDFAASWLSAISVDNAPKEAIYESDVLDTLKDEETYPSYAHFVDKYRP